LPVQQEKCGYPKTDMGEKREKGVGKLGIKSVQRRATAAENGGAPLFRDDSRVISGGELEKDGQLIDGTVQRHSLYCT